MERIETRENAKDAILLLFAYPKRSVILRGEKSPSRRFVVEAAGVLGIRGRTGIDRKPKLAIRGHERHRLNASSGTSGAF